MSSGSKFYLGRNQKIFGPLSAEEVDALGQSGQLCSYTWIFKEGDNHWNPIDPPPAIPGSETRTEIRMDDTPARPAPALRLVRPAEVAPQRSPARSPERSPERSNVPPETFRAVLFDHRNAISGWLSSASDGGCELISDQNGSDPLFVVRGAAFLSLHDTHTGQTLKLRVRISLVSRKPDGSGWVYRARWQSVPSLLSHLNRGQSAAVAA